MSSVHEDVNFFKTSPVSHWRKAIGVLAKRGGLFVAIRKGEKKPTSKGWNKTENTLSAAEAFAHLATGGNVGHASGTGNVYTFDFDRNAERGYECAQLAGAFTVGRVKAPDKAKIFFTCDDIVPTRPRNKKYGFDLLGVNANGTHAQGVIAGMHPSDDPYLWTGHTIPHLPVDTVAALYAEWADGEELFPAMRESQSDATYASADLARVADALKYVNPNDMDYNAWVGKLGALHDAFGDEARDLAIEWADGKHGEVKDKWKSFDREYTGEPATLNGIFYLARKNGWPDIWLQDRLKEYRRWIASPEAIEALKAAGFRNPEQARKLLDTILQKCEERKSLRITPGYAYLSKNSTIALGGLGRYLARLFAAGLINLQLGEKGGGATMIELVFANVNSYTPDGETIHISKNWHVYREQRDSEAFINSHHAYSSTRTQATLPTLGANGLGALMALLDGPATTKEAASSVGYTYGVMAQALRRYVAHGLVGVATGERGRKVYTLAADWRDILKANMPKLPTYAVQLVRHVDSLKSKEAMARFKGDDEKAEKIDKEYVRMSALLERIIKAAGIIPFVRPERAKDGLAPLNHKRISLSLDRTKLPPKYQALTEAEKWRRKEYAKDIDAAGYEWGDLNAWAAMEHGPGWWMHKDKTEIVGQYRLFQMSQMPSIHWDGTLPAAQAPFDFDEVVT